jgi:hypothetical protein
MRYIYKLIDPITSEIRYIGQTDNIKRRYNDHMSSSLNKNSSSYNTYKSCWIRKILNNNLLPIIEVIEECDTLETSNIREKYYINKLNNDGYKLTNSYVSDVTEFSIETKKKMSSAKKGKTLEEIVGEEKASELRNYYSERMKMQNPNKSGDDIVRGKISDTLKEYFSNPENHWAYGLKMTNEHNEKLRQSKLNNPKNVGNRLPRTEEQKEKIRKSILGKKVKRHRILQYDLDGNLIREWKSLREIESHDSTLKRNQISKCCKSEKDFYAGFIWKYKTNI